jgi:DNA-binding NtrC family response regulator
VKVDVRIMSATNRDLIADVKQGRFREDLFYRLHVFPIAVPPLRERPGDIPALARHFLARFAAEEGKRIRLISQEALGLLCAFQWPGNIRQLENAIFRAVVLAEGDCLGVAEFPQITARVSPSGGGETMAALISSESLFAAALNEPDTPSIAAGDELPTGPAAPSPAPAAAAIEALPLLDDAGEMRPLEEFEAELIRYAVTHYRGQMSEVARRLRIGRSTLYRKLEALGLTGERAETDDAVARERQPRKIA